MDEKPQDVKNFVGWLYHTGGVKSVKVFFDSQDEADMIEAGFFYFVVKDYKENVSFLLINPNDGFIKIIEYDFEK